MKNKDELKTVFDIAEVAFDYMPLVKTNRARYLDSTKNRTVRRQRVFWGRNSTTNEDWQKVIDILTSRGIEGWKIFEGISQLAYEGGWKTRGIEKVTN